MTSDPVITPLKPGERPTEAGWYVLCNEFGFNNIVEVALSGNVVFSGCEMSETVDEVLSQGERFIARIYPERIGEE